MKLVLRDGDRAIFDVSFGSAVVVAPPGVITGSSRVAIDGAKACVLGDEASVFVTAAYSNGNYLGGTGTLTITSVGSDQRSSSASSSRSALLRVGTTFRARLQVTKPAQNLSAELDPNVVYDGTGTFSSANTRALA